MAWVPAGTAAAATADGTVTFNEDFFGTVSSPLDQDLIEFEEVSGSSLTIRVRRLGKSNFLPAVELLDQNMALIVTGSLKKGKNPEAQINKFPAPYSGTYFVRVASFNGSTGNYRARVRGKPQTKFNGAGTIATIGEIDAVDFTARADAALSGTIESPSGSPLEPTLVEVEDPSGALVAIAGKSTLNSAKTKLSFSGITLPRLGDYQLRLTGQNATTGDYAFKLNVKNPKAIKGKVYEDEFPNNPGPTGPGFRLDDVLFARGVRSIDGLSIEAVSPLTVVKTNPVSGLPIPGTLKGLFPGVHIEDAVSFELGPFYGPPIVPRNAVIVLRFTASVAIDSLKLDADGHLTPDSPIQVGVNDVSPPIEAFVQGKDVILNPVTQDELGFAASPLVLNSFGKGVASTTGTGLISLDPVNGASLMSSQGGVLKPRTDLIGSPAAGGQPVGFNPGNSALDFLDQSSAGLVDLTFNGFLPDLDNPRIVREYRFDGVYTPTSGDSIGVQSITLSHAAPFVNLANGGKGEWANGVLRLRPEGPNLETLVIESSNTMSLGGGVFLTQFMLASPIKIPLATGQTWELARAEYYEPDPSNPLDADVFDPNNPLLLENKVLENFLEVRDVDGNLLDPADGVPSDATIAMRFSEAMEITSFQPYETFFVTEFPPSGNPGVNNVGRAISSGSGRIVTFAPDRAVQFGPNAGTFERIGFGSTPRALLLHLVVVPAPDVLVGLLGQSGYADFVAGGQRGVTDLAGRPVAIPYTDLSPSVPFLDITFPFETLGDASLDDFGAVVHRFKGAPKTGTSTDGTAGVSFADMPTSLCGPNGNIYGPRIADLNLFSNGFLAGAPVLFIQKIHDDFNPPTDGQFSAFGFGTSTPIGGFSVIGGARLQHVYRAQDCSPDPDALAGSLLHLRHVHYAPIGGFVNDTVIPDFQVHAGHSRRVPLTDVGGGIPNFGASGLGFNFAGNYDATDPVSGSPLPRTLLSGTQTGPNAFTGVAFTINNNLVFKPAGTGNSYHPLPDQPFQNLFPYDNGVVDPQTSPGGNGAKPHALLLEYRTRGSPSGAVATSNGFTFAVGILSSALPRFRVYTIGAGCTACCTQPGGNCDFTCFTAFGPAVSPPINPDTIVNAAGPDPAPPGMSCNCPRHPTVAPTPPPFAPAGCVVQNTNQQNIVNIANGGASPNDSTLNYGDNSRYFMVFDYVKKTSVIRSPWVRAQPPTLADPTWLAPIFDPPLSQLPGGTALTIRFRASSDGAGGAETAFITPTQMVDENNVLNNGVARPFIQFELTAESNVTTQLQPAIDTLILPFRK